MFIKAKMKLNFSVAIIETEKKKKKPTSAFWGEILETECTRNWRLSSIHVDCKTASKIKEQ